MRRNVDLLRVMACIASFAGCGILNLILANNALAVAPSNFYSYSWPENSPYIYSTPMAACVANFVAAPPPYPNKGPEILFLTNTIWQCQYFDTQLNGYRGLSAIYGRYSCPDGKIADTSKSLDRQCSSICPVGLAGVASCQPNKSQGQQCSASTPNPIHTGTGNKYWSDTDYRAVSLRGIDFGRDYNSQNTAAISTLGTAWRHRYDSVIASGLTINGVAAVLMARPDGKAYAYTEVNAITYTSQDADIIDHLEGVVDGTGTLTGYRYTVAADNSIETYDAAGKLQSIQDRNGLLQTLTYSDTGTPVAIAPQAGLLLQVTDAFGRQLHFTYDSSSRIATMTDPAGGQYAYSYDGNNNLASVTYPDGNSKGYRYNESTYTGGTDLPHALTGLIDENGVRYASYWYSADGKAYQEQHAGGVDQYQIAYSADGSHSTVTDPLGTARTTSFTTILGVIKATSQSQPGGSGCGAAFSALTYDANGNVASRTDFNGTVTTYTHDLSRNLETRRVEAAGTAAARTIGTEWHPDYRLPTRIAEPNKLTVNSYDTHGNLLSRSEQATSDVDGSQGFAAPVVGSPRLWQYTYNDFGQAQSATDPNGHTTTYAYDGSGNLVTITNAAGQVTTLSAYDANGRVGRITDANGLVTDLTYSARGWLTSKKTGDELTRYDYDGVGQLVQVTLPDGSAIHYTYDDAHRLTDIADSLGDRIHTTLDAIGNRIQEQTTDPNGTLTRHTSRIYDALNRLQQITGGVQ